MNARLNVAYLTRKLGRPLEGTREPGRMTGECAFVESRQHRPVGLRARGAGRPRSPRVNEQRLLRGILLRGPNRSRCAGAPGGCAGPADKPGRYRRFPAESRPNHGVRVMPSVSFSVARSAERLRRAETVYADARPTSFLARGPPSLTHHTRALAPTTTEGPPD
jgi:hypothetical protein